MKTLLTQAQCICVVRALQKMRVKTASCTNTHTTAHTQAHTLLWMETAVLRVSPFAVANRKRASAIDWPPPVWLSEQTHKQNVCLSVGRSAFHCTNCVCKETEFALQFIWEYT